jgi:hypothetical protein
MPHGSRPRLRASQLPGCTILAVLPCLGTLEACASMQVIVHPRDRHVLVSSSSGQILAHAPAVPRLSAGGTSKLEPGMVRR